MKIKNASENTDAGATIAAVPLCFIKTLRSENSEAAYTALQDNGCLRCAYFARIAFNTQLAKGIWGNDSRPSHTKPTALCTLLFALLIFAQAPL